MRRLAGRILFLLLTISSQVSTFRLQPRSNKAVDVGGSNAIHRWPNGKNCTGRGNDSTSGNGRGSNPSASSSSTSVNTTTTTPMSSSPSLSTPTPDPGYTNIVITQSSTQMTWSSGWDVQISSCDSTQQSKITTKPNEWFTLITPSNSSPYIYIDLAVSNASFTVYINGMQPDADLGDLSNNCAYHALGPLLTGSFTNNITIYVNGPSSGSSDRNWSFMFNHFIVGQQLIATAASSSSSTATLAQLNAAISDKPQVMLSSLISILLAAVFWT